MARKKTQSKRRKAAKPAPSQPTGPEVPAKRASLVTLGLYAMGAVVVGGGGTAFAYDFMRALGEQDLSKVGNGTPAIVQIHDPQCGLCRSLQSEARQALKAFDREEVTYLVANIRNTEGAAFASRMGVGHVTLLLFDGSGALVHSIHGVTPDAVLEDAFRQHLGLGAASGTS